MNKIIFRADGNARIGMGHVMRCLALADMLGSGFDRRFAIVQPPSAIQELVEARHVPVINLPTSRLADFLAVTEPDDIAVLDGYDFDETYQRSVRQRLRTLVYIDDLMKGHQVADVLINHTGGITANDYKADSYTQFCLGPHYALLRPKFLQPQPSTPPGDGPLFVNMGGADPQNHSLAVLEAVRQLDPAMPVDLVLGAFHPDRPALERFREHLPNLIIRQGLDAVQMRDALCACSLAITACSTIAYEACAVNRPLIGIVTAENQARLALFLANEKLALSVHFPHLLSRMKPALSLESALKIAIQGYQFMPDLVTDTLAKQRQFFDGRSPERFRALFHQV